MLKRFIVVTLFLAALVLDAHAQANPRPAEAPPEQEPAPAMAVPPGYRRVTQGRRDPFVNPVPRPVKPLVEVPVVRPPGLKGLLLSEAAIAGIVWSREAEMNRAVISTPAGKTYFARKGESLFDAVIKDIQRDGIVFELRVRDAAGKDSARELVRRVRSSP